MFLRMRSVVKMHNNSLVVKFGHMVRSTGHTNSVICFLFGHPVSVQWACLPFTAVFISHLL